mgnify:CR=1 FL=1
MKKSSWNNYHTRNGHRFPQFICVVRVFFLPRMMFINNLSSVCPLTSICRLQAILSTGNLRNYRIHYFKKCYDCDFKHHNELCRMTCWFFGQIAWIVGGPLFSLLLCSVRSVRSIHDEICFNEMQFSSNYSKCSMLLTSHKRTMTRRWG